MFLQEINVDVRWSNLGFSGGKKCCAGDVSAITVRIVLNVLIIALESWTSRALPVMSVSTMTAKATDV